MKTKILNKILNVYLPSIFEHIYGNNIPAIKAYIKLGYDINHRNNNKQTPLHIACNISISNKEHIIYILLNAGADINAKDICSMTPLSCLSRQDPSYERICSMFLFEKNKHNIKERIKNNTICNKIFKYEKD